MTPADTIRDAIVLKAGAIIAKSSSVSVDAWALEIQDLAAQIPALVPPIVIVERRTPGSDRREKDDTTVNTRRRVGPQRKIQSPRVTHYVTGILITSANPVNIETGGAGEQITWTLAYLPYTTTGVSDDPPTETPMFKSSNVAVCTVSSSGLVSPVGNGTATISLRVSSGATTTVSVAVTTPIETVQSVVLSPSSIAAQVSAGNVILTATAYAGANGTGNIIPAQAYTANSSDTGKATVAQSGDTCTVSPVAAGTTNVKVTTSGIDSNLVTVTVAAAGVASNEPPGFTALAEYSGGYDPAGTIVYKINAPTPPAVLGQWWHYGDNLLIGTDATAPKSPSQVSKHVFRAGLGPGWGPEAQFGCVFGVAPGYGEMYQSTWFKLDGADFETQMVGVKILGYWSVGAGPPETAGKDQLYCIMRGNQTSTSIMSQWNFDMYQQGAVASRALPQNMNTGTKIQANTWHRMEFYFKVNTIGVSDGLMKVWLDGTQINNQTGVRYRNATYPNGFWNHKLDPIWGGGGGTAKTRDDTLLVDHIYISGVPL